MEQTIKERYQGLVDDLASLKITKAKNETTVESLETRQKLVLVDIKKIAGTDDVKIAKEKMAKLKVTLDTLNDEAESILNAEPL
jgi:hypothetical protein